MSDTNAEFVALQRAVSGRYSLEHELGRGGMGVVFLARDVALSRRVAIKLLLPHLSQQPEMRARFLREAQTAAGLFHPNIVPVHLVEQDGDLVYFVMTYVQGETLGQRVRRAGPLPAAAVRRIVQEVAWALSYAHEKGVVHRDIKPDNILLERPGGRALVGDFGIARVAQLTGATAQGEVLGTIDYMSPEQATGGTVDGRSDLYSLGATAYFALTGEPPFRGANAISVINHHVNTPAPRVAGRVADVPPAFAESIDRCLAKDAAQRFQTGENLAEALGDAPSGAAGVPPEIRRLIRRIRVAGAVIGVGLGSMAVLPMLATEFGRALEKMEVEILIPVGILIIFFIARGVARLIADARRALRAGYEESFVHQALLADARAQIEEGLVEAAAETPTLLSRTLARLQRPVFASTSDRPSSTNPVVKAGMRREQSIASAALLFWLGIGVLALGIATQKGVSLAIGSIAVIAGAMLFAAGPTVGAQSPLIALDWGERMLVGRLGRLLFRVARRGLDRRHSAGSPGALTEVALAAAIDDLLAALPREVRARFPDVQQVIRSLEAEAGRLRQRDVQLSAVLARVDVHAPAISRGEQERLQNDLESARVTVRGRLATAVAAIESIRLDLLRLQAGVGSPTELTDNLERAREIASAMDAHIAAQREVDAMLKRDTHISTSTA